VAISACVSTPTHHLSAFVLNSFQLKTDFSMAEIRIQTLFRPRQCTIIHAAQPVASKDRDANPKALISLYAQQEAITMIF
jgi:hypothetical protein